ncbi:50S ribosomal protein L13 [Marinilabiliaceae bacterium JC040]|nr:50S ribosomal protein L13 [Marinilabiliaceae bacterium JC040]
MDTLSYKTISANKATAQKEWVLVDAEGQTLGRLASKVAKLLRGKYKPSFTPHCDCGDNVVIINAEKIQVSGKKFDSKNYLRHTGYPGGQRVTTIKQALENHPERVIQHAVKGMLPKNRLGRELFRNMYVYAGTEHMQEAQQPKNLDLNTLK